MESNNYINAEINLKNALFFITLKRMITKEYITINIYSIDTLCDYYFKANLKFSNCGYWKLSKFIYYWKKFI